ncbi:addiction module antidote protein [Sphingomonas sp.]|uniref:addiction module antidote protein n=1 Tax=Sphingomonas sp. TaxID=28214 RepID=UPI002DBD9425|nr:addiction module antidote protein [Sphingomonas sp.]
MRHEAMLAQLFAAPPRLGDLAPDEAALVRATRSWVVAQRHGRRCPLDAAATHLGTPAAARALHLLLASVGAAWPDPVAIAPPCCAHLTHDEATLLGMVLAAHRHGRPVFDALLCEMLDADARDRLFASASLMGQSIDS